MAKPRVKLNPSFWTHPFGVPFSDDVVPSSLFLKHKHYLVVDVETKKLAQDVGGWAHIDKLGISVACAFDSATGEYTSYTEDQLEKLNQLCYDRLVIGYNIKGFDLKVMEPYGLNIKKVDCFDIMLDVEAITRQRFLKLETIAQGTLGIGKSADGLLAVEWYKQGLIQKIIEYCLQDVKVTKDIFEYGREHGHVKIGMADGSAKHVPVSWS